MGIDFSAFDGLLTTNNVIILVVALLIISGMFRRRRRGRNDWMDEDCEPGIRFRISLGDLFRRGRH